MTILSEFMKLHCRYEDFICGIMFISWITL